MAQLTVGAMEICGAPPKALALSDGSRLELNPFSALTGSAGWMRIFEQDELGPLRTISVAEAYELAGDEFAGYVTVRTRAEIEWLHLVAERVGELEPYVRGEADCLARDMDCAIRQKRGVAR